MAELIEGSKEILARDEAIVINRCIAYGKKYGSFNFYPASNLYPNTQKKRLVRWKRTIKIEIMNVKNDAQSKQWKKVIEHIVNDTCFISSKCYIDKIGVVNYYLNINWSKFVVGYKKYEDYVVPPPKLKTVW